jgi:hypothetical protein
LPPRFRLFSPCRCSCFSLPCLLNFIFCIGSLFNGPIVYCCKCKI